MYLLFCGIFDSKSEKYWGVGLACDGCADGLFDGVYAVFAAGCVGLNEKNRAFKGYKEELECFPTKNKSKANLCNITL